MEKKTENRKSQGRLYVVAFIHSSITIVPSAKSSLSGHILHLEGGLKDDWLLILSARTSSTEKTGATPVQTEPRGGNLLEEDTWKIASKLAENKESLFSFRLCIYVG